MGTVTFFDGPLIASLLESDEPDTRLPAELREHGVLRREELNGDVVAARVQLDNHSLDSAVEAATRTTLALVRHASLYTGGWVWRLRQGHMTFLDGQWVAGVFDDRLVDGPSQSFHNPQAKFWVAEELERRTPALGDRLACPDPVIDELIELLGALKEIIDGSAEVRALMVPRLLERVSALIGHDDWPGFLRAHMRGQWATRKVTDVLVDDAYDCLRFGPLSLHDDVIDESGLSALANQVWQPGRELRMRVVIPRLKEASSLFEVGSSRWIRLRDSAAGTESGPAAIKWISRFACEFDALVSRLERCRHGLMHGWPVPSEVVETVSGFANHLAIQGVHLALEGILRHGDVKAGFLSASQEATRLRQRLAQAGADEIGGILFPLRSD